jgi:micrococcal nuclease
MRYRIATRLTVGSLIAGSLVAVGWGFTNAQERWALVQQVIDGDTVKLSTGERVRYIGVDTPELHHPRKPVEFYAREAKEFNRRLVEGKRVRLEFDVQRYDRYGRLLAYVYLEDGTFVNAELLRQGYAQLLTIPPNVKYANMFLELQRQARENRRGLWGRP